MRKKGESNEVYFWSTFGKVHIKELYIPSKLYFLCKTAYHRANTLHVKSNPITKNHFFPGNALNLTCKCYFSVLKITSQLGHDKFWYTMSQIETLIVGKKMGILTYNSKFKYFRWQRPSCISVCITFIQHYLQFQWVVTKLLKIF